MKVLVDHSSVATIQPERAQIRDSLAKSIATRSARIGVIGLGYVGLPLALAFSRAGFSTLGFELNGKKAKAVNEGLSYITDISDAEIRTEIERGSFGATLDFGQLADCDCVIMCVPTPLSRTNDPDLSFIENATKRLRQALRRGQLVILESTTYPGCTDELVLEELNSTGLTLDVDFLLAFSPERLDPGNKRFDLERTPRIVGGCSADSTAVAKLLYESIVPEVHTVSSARVAEAAKLLENTFRAVNIGLVNELAVLCYRMNIDVWEVIEAATTKPYGFMPFYPGPGIGGHCIPLDPVYLSWRGRQFGFVSRLIDVAQQINEGMPAHVVQLVTDALNSECKALKGSRVIVLGVTYKKDVGDVRESPSIAIIETLRQKGARVTYHDPFVPSLDVRVDASPKDGSGRGTPPPSRRAGSQRIYSVAAEPNGRKGMDRLVSVPLSEEVLSAADCVVIATDHSSVDYRRVATRASLVIDTRHAIDDDLRTCAGARIVRL